MDSYLCEQEDYEWICSFYQRLKSAEDPLARLAKIKRRSLKKPMGSSERTGKISKATAKKDKGGGHTLGLLLALAVILLIAVHFLGNF